MTKAKPQMPAEVLAKKVLELRNRRGWTQDELAKRMTKLGVAWGRTTIAKVEHGDRQVTVDELICLARALNTQPAALLTDDVEQLLTPTTRVSPQAFWQWMTGHQPIRHVTRTPSKQRKTRFAALDELPYEPTFVEIAELRLPGIRNVLDWASQVQNLAASPATTEDDELLVLDDVAEQLKTLEAEVRLLRQRADVYRGITGEWTQLGEGSEQ